jgi:hypothetical protein
MSGLVRLAMIHGSILAEDPMVSEVDVPIEEFPVTAHHTGMRVWTAISFDDKRLVVLAIPELTAKAIDRWKTLRIDVRVDSSRFGLLLKGRHVSH